MEIVLLHAVDHEERAIGGVGAVAALVDVGVDVAVAARDVEAGQVVEQGLEIEIAAALDLLDGEGDDGGRRLAQRLVGLGDRGHPRRLGL